MLLNHKINVHLLIIYSHLFFPFLFIYFLFLRKSTNLFYVSITGSKSKINVLLLSDTDNKGKIVTLVQSLTRAVSLGNLDPEDITDQLISEKLDMKGMPNPDLALIYGYTCSTHGLLPWHTRTTEFL